MNVQEIFQVRMYLAASEAAPVDADAVEGERRRVLAPLGRPRGIPHQQYEYKVRRLVNDYLQPPKSETRLQQHNFGTRLRKRLETNSKAGIERQDALK